MLRKQKQVFPICKEMSHHFYPIKTILTTTEPKSLSNLRELHAQAEASNHDELPCLNPPRNWIAVFLRQSS
jgi:hypothetical protein